MRPALENCFRTNNPTLGHIIGLPIRGSDKCYREVNGKREGEADCISLAQTMTIAQRLHASQPWIDSVLVTSEDKSVLESAPRLPEMMLGSDRGRQWKLFKNDNDVQQGTGRSFSHTVESGEGEKVLTPAKITESILTTLSCQVLPSHHIVLLKSSECILSITRFLYSPSLRAIAPNVSCLAPHS
jgi:hypothetical protein